MPNETTPEIQRSDLSAALLQLMGFGQNPIEFAYMDTPKRTNRKLKPGLRSPSTDIESPPQ